MQVTVDTAMPIQTPSKWRRRARRAARWTFLVLSLIFALSLIGRDDYQPDELQERAIVERFEDSTFDLVGWEISAIRDKLQALFEPSAAGLTNEESTELIYTYLDRAQEIARLGAELERLAANNNGTSSKTAQEVEDVYGDPAAIEEKFAELRADQEKSRSTVEQLIQSQISWALLDEDIDIRKRVLPPVLFSFTEPPKKLVVSPRERIETKYAHMLAADITLDEINENEQEILEQEDLSAYVTNIGGLGAFPTMVIDRASLGWILSTVAHEWVHNYLTFFPLGLNYGKNNEITIINETVAEIVGVELGQKVEERYYPTPIPTSTPTPSPTATTSSQDAAEVNASSPESDSPDNTAPPFDFRTEMRETRLQVDQLLSDGKVEEAERYMEERRLVFVENGYNLRVLNQAYFAFHGSYGTSAASTSTIGPKLEELRTKSGDLKTFLESVRWFTTEADIDQALESIP